MSYQPRIWRVMSQECTKALFRWKDIQRVLDGVPNAPADLIAHKLDYCARWYNAIGCCLDDYLKHAPQEEKIIRSLFGIGVKRMSPVECAMTYHYSLSAIENIGRRFKQNLSLYAFQTGAFVSFEYDDIQTKSLWLRRIFTVP